MTTSITAPVAGTVTADPEALRRAAGDLQQQAYKLQGLLGTAESEMQSQLTEAWGLHFAAEAAKYVLQSWSKSDVAMFQRFSDMAARLYAAADAYEATDHGTARGLAFIETPKGR